MTEEVKASVTTPPANAAPAAQPPVEDVAALKARLETQEKELAGYKLEKVVEKIAKEHGVAADLLTPIAGKMTAEELAEYAKKLPKAGATAADLILVSNRGGVGGGMNFTRAQLSDHEFYRKNKEAILQAYAEGRIKE